MDNFNYWHPSDTKENRINQLSDIKRQIKSFQQKLQKINPVVIPKKVQQNFTNRLEFLNQIKKQTHSLQQKLPPYKLLNEFNSDILSLIFDHFLIMKDIIILRQTRVQRIFNLFKTKWAKYGYVLHQFSHEENGLRTINVVRCNYLFFTLSIFIERFFRTVKILKIEPNFSANIKNQYNCILSDSYKYWSASSLVLDLIFLFLFWVQIFSSPKLLYSI